MNEKLPALHFYPGDWYKDPGVMALNSVERGVWFQMLLLMFESKRRGYLELADKKYPEKEMASLFKISEPKLQKIIVKLISFDVGSLEKNTQILYSRRMVRDEEKRQLLIKAGSKGAKTRWGKGSESMAPPIRKTIASPEDEDEGEGEKKLGLKDNERKLTIDDLNLAGIMRGAIESFKPDYQFRQSGEEWASQILFIRRSRKKAMTQILELWEWARENDFWKKTILTPWDLEKHWDKLEIAQDDTSGAGDADSWIKKQRAKKGKK